MYNNDHYKVDRVNQRDPEASLDTGAVLYRIASPTHWKKEDILTGNGAEQGSPPGRFHRIRQRASYCANNGLVCMGEMLYHMYRRVLDGIRDNQPSAHLNSWKDRTCRFVVFSVDAIPEIVYADSEGARMDYSSPRLPGTPIVCPDAAYEPCQTFADRLRALSKKGVVYPSSRHSADFAYVFFNDETSRVRDDFFEALELRLQLIPETQDFSIAPTGFSLFEQKLHPTMGYYEFSSPAALNDLKSRKLIHPENIRERGYVDFVRRRYPNYPDDAYRS